MIQTPHPNKMCPDTLNAEIRDTSLLAFMSVIRYIYTGDEGYIVIKNGDNLDLLFQILCLADRYLLEELKKLLMLCIEGFQVSVRNYATVFKNCALYSNLLGFETLCRDLRDRCALVILKSWGSAMDGALFWTKDFEDDPSLKQALVQRHGELASMKCDTCGLSKAKCPIGEWLTKKNCVAGMRVKALLPGKLRFVRGGNPRLCIRGTLGTVKEFYKTGKFMTFSDDDEDEHRYESEDDSSSDIEHHSMRRDQPMKHLGVLAVLWDRHRKRTIYPSFPTLLIISH